MMIHELHGAYLPIRSRPSGSFRLLNVRLRPVRAFRSRLPNSPQLPFKKPVNSSFLFLLIQNKTAAKVISLSNQKAGAASRAIKVVGRPVFSLFPLALVAA